jgi:hypothetical protein
LAALRFVRVIQDHKEKAVTTGRISASKASKELKDRKSTAGEKTVAASDLSQAKKPKPAKKPR